METETMDWPSGGIGQLIKDKHKEYIRGARFYLALYYVTRIAGGVSASLLPFVVPYSQVGATILAITVAVLTVLDTAVSPKEKSVLYAKATDLLALTEMQAHAEYLRFKPAIDIIIQTETASLQRLVGFRELVKNIQDMTPNHAVQHSDEVS